MAIELNWQAVKKGKLVKVVIINASARDKGALSTLVAEAAKGASEGNATVIGTLYAGELTSKGLKDRDVQKARVLRKTLANHLRAER